MSRVLIIGSHTPVSREIGDSLCAADLPAEYSAGNADALKRLRFRSFGVVITSPDSALDEDLALLAEMRAIRPGVKCIAVMNLKSFQASFAMLMRSPSTATATSPSSCSHLSS